MDSKILSYSILGLFIALVIPIHVSDALHLQELPTNKPRATKYTPKPKSTSLKLDPPSTSIYRLNNTNGVTCILIRTDALLSIQYRNKLKEDAEADIYLPDELDIKGDCTEEDSGNIILSFKGFVLGMYFKKTPGGERWYISSMELSYSSSNSKFEHIDRPGLDVKLSTPAHNTLLFPTPVGKSYQCNEETIVSMYSQEEIDKAGHLAKLYLRDLRMQSFMFKQTNAFGPPFKCTATGSYRSETAPLVVGLILALAVVSVVTGYGVWRYLKVKKVQYGTME